MLCNVLQEASQPASQRYSSWPAVFNSIVIILCWHLHNVVVQCCCAGVHGRVSELVRVTNRKYNLAMAVVMQRDLDSVVVENRKAGFACIDYLKASK
jgi:hypothetical protein